VNDRTVTIFILDHDNPLFSFKGNEYTVFAVSQDVLWYLNAAKDSNGSVVAVDLKTAKQWWTQPLPTVGQGFFSWHKARRTLKLTGDGIQIHSKETAGEYIAYFDFKTGKQLSLTILSEVKNREATTTQP